MLCASGTNAIYLQEPYRLRAGDILGSCSHTRLGFWINLATWRPPWIGLSHISSLVEYPEDSGKLVICEATMSCPDPCLIAGKRVEGVQFQPIGRRVAGYPGKVWVYPLLNELSPAQSRGLTRMAIDKCGAPYDRIGAFQARQAGFGWLRRWLLSRPEDLNAYYCAETALELERDTNQVKVQNVSNYSPNTAIDLLRRGIVGPRRRLVVQNTLNLVS